MDSPAEFDAGPARRNERTFPASANQKRMFVLNQLSPDGTEYNVPLAIRLRGALDVARLRGAIAALVERHDGLRTSFRIAGDDVVQSIEEHVSVHVQVRVVKSLDDVEEIRKRFVRPFDLGRAPLLRAWLLRLDETDHVLLLDLHHIVCDGVSVDVLREDLGRLYDGQTLAPLTDDYKDFALWQRSFAGTPEAKAQAEYWLGLLGGERPAVDLPLDHPRCRMRSFEGDRIFVRPGKELAAALRALAAKNRVSMYMLLLAAYNVFLSKYTGQEDVLVGTLVAGRGAERFRRVVGLFVNTLVLRSRPRGELTFAEYLKHVRNECLGAFENQDFQFEDLVDRIAPPRDLGRHPLFDTMFSALTDDDRVSAYGGVDFCRHELGYEISKFDLSLTAIERPDQELLLELEYCTALFCKATIERMAAHYMNVLRAVVADPKVRLGDVELLAPDEVRALAAPPAAASAHAPNVLDRFEVQVRRDPSAPALSFGDVHLSYGELAARARALASRLAAEGVRRGDLVGVSVTPSIEMVVLLLGVLEAGAAYLPIDPATPPERFDTIVADSGIAVLLVGADPLRFTVTGDTCSRSGLRVIGVGDVDGPTPGGFERARLDPDDAAYVIYTSGSTGTPKGVRVSHRALTSYVTWATETYVGDEARAFALHSPLWVDLTVTSVFAPLVSGNRIVIYRADDPVELVRQIVTRNEVELVKLTPTHLAILAEVLRDVDAGRSALRGIVVGGEDLKTSLAEKVHAAFAGRVRIWNEYGPTEATVGCTLHVYDPCADKGPSVPIGGPTANARVFVLDRHGKPVPPGVTGELFVAGVCLADGYLNNPRLTEERFVVRRIGDERVRAYRTGDLVRAVSGGSLEFLGRNDDQVKIRGFRVELGEIEANLLRLSGVREAAVTRRVDAAGDVCLCAYVVVEGGAVANRLRSALAERLPAHMVPMWIVPLDRMPVARGGKLDKGALPDPQAAATGERPFHAPRSRVEAAIARIWEQVLGVPRVSVDDDFFDLGGQSLKATLMTLRVNRELGASLALRDVFAHPRVRDLAPLVAQRDKAATAARIAIEPIGERPHYAVSSAQKRLFILHQLAPEDVQYNVPWAISIRGQFDRARWERALAALIQRHEPLRTSFAIVDDEIVQMVHARVAFALEPPPQADTLQRAIEELVRPFDLCRAPLLRATVLESGVGTEHTLLVDMHHVVCDGLSAPIILEDLLALYEDDGRGRTLAPPALAYKDYAAWQRAFAASDEVAAQVAWWTKQFEGELPVLDLPTDFPRGAVQSFEGDVVRVAIDPSTVARIRAIQRDAGATMHMTLLAAYTVLLAKYTGKDDIVVGTPVAGRYHPALERMVGMFVNTLAMRNRPSAELTFRQFLDAVRTNALDAYGNQDCQFEELVERLSIERDLSKNPLFDTMFASMEGGLRTYEVDGLTVAPVDFDWKISKFDLTLLATEQDDRIDLEIEYSTRLFRRPTIERLGAHYRRLLDEIGRDPDQRIAELDPLTPAERRQILLDGSRTDHAYPADRSIHQLVEEQVERDPDRVAVVFGDTALSYGDLNRRANQLARALVDRGVAREEVVAIIAGPSAEMIVGILAILKAGCAYLPMDRDAPEPRVRVLLEDSGARVVLVAGGAAWHDDQRAVIDLAAPALYRGEGSNLLRAVGGRDLAYVIYTSGTTGVPKGVMIEHHSVNNLCAWHNQRFEVTAADRATKYARFSFDASVWEIFPYLQAGAALHVIDERIRLDLPRLNRYFEDHGVTIAFLPTQVCELFLEQDNRSLRVLLTGGDRLRRLRPTRYRVVNNYGPTESTVVATSCTVSPDADGIPIGEPISNTRVYVLGSGDRLVPVGVPGELCVAGVGLARGYLNAPAQTEARFVRDPFEPRGRMYRTGDLVRWRPDGNLEYIGRTDHQVKIRGCRTEPREIETRVLAHEAVRDAVVLAREDGQHNKHLCAYVVWHGEPREAELRAYLQSQLPDYMVPAFIVSIPEVPVNARGKVDTAKLPSPERALGTGRSHVPARNDVERRLVEIWSRVLEHAPIGVHDDFFEIGGDSLRATVMLARANKELHAAVALGAVFDNPTIAGLARCFEHATPPEAMALTPLPRRPAYAVTPIQALLYAISSSVRGTEYNLPMAYVLDGELSVDRLEGAFHKLIQRHESLRTSFHMRDGQVVQVVSPTVDFSIDRMDECNEREVDEIARDFIRPFDLGKAPLVRAALVPTGKRRHVLLLDVHHLVSDGTSMGILFREMAALYAGQELSAPGATFKDFAGWLGGYLQREEVRAHREYWRGVFADIPPLLRLDVDFPRHGRFTFNGGMIEFEARQEIHRALKAMCSRHGVTLYMLLLAAYYVLLSKYGRQEDMILAAPTSGRYLADVQDVVGMFVTTHVVRSKPRADLRFDEFLQHVKGNVRDTLDHQGYQLWEFFLDYALRNGGKQPFSSVFVVQDQAFKAMSMPGLEVRERDANYHTAKFDLTLGAVERDGGLHFELEFSSDVYRRSTARRIADHYLHLLEQIVADPGRRLRELELLTPTEKEALLRRSIGAPLDASSDRPLEGTVLARFERHAAEHAGRAAVVSGGDLVSYGELNRRANRLARHLRRGGIAAGDRIALRLRPSADMVVAALAVWKAGAAYVPVSPGWPQKRVESVLAQSGARLLLRDEDFEDPKWCDGDGEDLGGAPGASALAYATGSGAMIEHRSLLARCRWYVERFGVTPDDRSAKYGDLSTSATIFELFAPLCVGASIAIVPASARPDQVLCERRVTLAWLPGPWCERLAVVEDTSLRALITWSRNVRPSRSGAYELVRCAGPAENTEVTTCCTVHGDGRSESLGRPIPGTDVWIIGHDGCLLPVGVTGELCVAGVGLSRADGGPAASRFAPNPHAASAPMCRTGESARWLSDGALERTARPLEVSIDGHRVSLAEIEQRLAVHPAVADAVVVFDDEEPRSPRLVAFVVLRGIALYPHLFVAELSAHLAEWLPGWMIPEGYVQVAAIPREADGRVQYEALPLPERPPAPPVDGEAARPPTAQTVASIAGDVLGVPHVAADASLRDLGMSSLAAMDLTARLCSTFGVAPGVCQVLATPTVSGISERLDEALRLEDERTTTATP